VASHLRATAVRDSTCAAPVQPLSSRRGSGQRDARARHSRLSPFTFGWVQGLFDSDHWPCARAATDVICVTSGVPAGGIDVHGGLVVSRVRSRIGLCRGHVVTEPCLHVYRPEGSPSTTQPPPSLTARPSRRIRTRLVLADLPGIPESRVAVRLGRAAHSTSTSSHVARGRLILGSENA
jgi:hypothetical protein